MTNTLFDDNGLVKGQNTDIHNGELTTNGLSNFVNGTAMETAIKSLQWAVDIISIIFVVGVIAMIFSIIFKHGQWQKYAQSTLLWTFFSLIILKALPFIIFSLQNFNDVDNLFDSALIMTQQAAIYIGVIGISLSLLFKFSHKLIKHPEFFKWQKTSRNMSIIMISFSIIGPFVFSLL